MRATVFLVVAFSMPVPAAEKSFPIIIAHRGASADAPENTADAFKLGFEQGADYAETDLRLSKDGKIVLIHDDNTKRTAGLDRKVREQTLEELRRLDAGSFKGEKWKGEPIPTLEEGLATVPKGKGIFLELKDGPEIVSPLVAALKETHLVKEQIAIIGFDRATVEEAKRKLPQYRVLWLVAFKKDQETGVWTPGIDEVISQARKCGLDGLDIKADSVVDRAFVDKARAAKLPLFFVWTVNDPAVAAAMQAAGVDGITTDRPAGLRAELARRAQR